MIAPTMSLSPSSSPPRGADHLVRSLETAGVRRLFTLSGSQVMSGFAATIDSQVELLHVRHEAAAVHMADAWGRLTGEPGVALVTAGPGFANTLSALYVATMAESPMVLLSGQAPSSQLGRGPFQEMSQADMAQHVTKSSWTADTVAGLGGDLARALRTARSGRPGPVHVALPVDLLEAQIERETAMPTPEEFDAPGLAVDSSSAQQIVDIGFDGYVTVYAPAVSQEVFHKKDQAADRPDLTTALFDQLQLLKQIESAIDAERSMYGLPKN